MTKRNRILKRMHDADTNGVMTDEMFKRGLGGLALADEKAKLTAKRRLILIISAVIIAGTGLFFVIS